MAGVALLTAALATSPRAAARTRPAAPSEAQPCQIVNVVVDRSDADGPSITVRMSCDALPLGADARRLVDEGDAGRAAPLERGVEIIHREADVVDARAPAREESRDRRLGVVGREKLDERLTGFVAGDARTVGISEDGVGHPEDVMKQRPKAVEGLHRNADMGDARAPASGIWHGNSARVE